VKKQPAVLEKVKAESSSSDDGSSSDEVRVMLHMVAQFDNVIHMLTFKKT